MEKEGPLAKYFDLLYDDLYCHERTFEKAEQHILKDAFNQVFKKTKLKEKDIDVMFGGDLLNQIISSGYAARDFKIPFLGLYGACSTMAESLSLGALLMDGDYADNLVASTSSHFSSAERQFRFPLEYGSQRNPSAQWTVTGSGAMVLGREGSYPCITYVTTGLVKDYGEKDANNMGAAMAPAAVDTIYKHLKDTGRSPDYYDYIVTGDLGKVGREITDKLLLEYGYDISKNHVDCGELIFDLDNQNVGSGGSGCGCSAVVASGYFYKKLMKKEIKSILLVSTGALMSPTSSLQGESIPGIAHAVAIENI